MARPMIKEAGMASVLLENPYYILLRYIEVFYLFIDLVIKRNDRK